MRAHSHGHQEIIAPVSGLMHVEVDGRPLSAGAGELLVYRAGAVHAERSDRRRPVDMYFVAFEHPELVAVLPAKLADARGRVPLMISWMVDELPAANAAGKAVALRLLDAVVAETLRAAETPPEPEFARRARALMREALAEPLTLDDLAAEAGMSRFHFVRSFRRAAGRTPMQELRMLRLEAAKSLVLTTSLPLKAVAARTGLGSEQHLSRLFRRHFGHPPGALRGPHPRGG
jgi:AraC-like DNA-binding protein